MARFDSNLLGKVTKSVGNVTMCYMRNQNIAKAKIFVRKDNPTPEILDQRARMKVLVRISRYLLPVIRKGFTGVGNGTTSNAFVAVNMKAVTVDENHVGTLDYDEMNVASGFIDPPGVEVTYSTETKSYTFQQEMEDEGGYALADDRVYAVLFETVLNRMKLVALKSRGENGSTVFALPSKWDSVNVKVYCFATVKNGSIASDSCLLTVV